MNKITLCLIITLMSFYPTFSQECGTLPPVTPEIYPDNPTTRNADLGSTFCINVKIHLVRNDDGSNGYIGGVSTDTNKIISKLNEYFNPHGIYLNKVGVNTINKTSFLEIDGENEFDNLLATDNDPNAINYYIVNNLYNLNSEEAYGAARTGTNRLAIVHHRIFSTESPHEFGHTLNLYHTHETDYGVEAINGSNCSSAGDLVCDTPADPKLQFDINYDANCNYTGGGGYNPDTSNVMSYGISFCIDGFSNGQGFRMRQALRYNSELQNVVANSCSLITDISLDGGDTICLNQNKTFSLQNLPSGVTASWDTSSNLTTISNNTTDITVNLSNTTSETINITAKLIINGIDYYISRDLTHLPVSSASNITLESFKSQPIYANRWTNITARYNGLISLYNPNHRFEWKWVVPSHQMIQNSPFESYIHVNPLTTLTSVYIKTQAENECGCSDWKGQWFDVVTPPSNCSTCPTDPGEIHY